MQEVDTTTLTAGFVPLGTLQPVLPAIEECITRWRNDGRLDGLLRLGAEELLALCRDDLPADYLRFLSEAGAGPLPADGLVMFCCPLDFDEVYGREDGGRYAIFATDAGGACYAFDRVDALAVVRIPTTGEPITPVGGDFTAFLSGLLD
ncbi:hypothetical protein [uncultured Tistrella sp.]|uniref:hypothetical protein n=1 Tax=Tistrella mobilis TaxID=171437 RepID=UPI000C0A818F|nr:hypothetical protein [uncultured Tistrella sp.]MAM75502.1 hypothetical protein [Tistrella sp.]